MSTLDEYLKKAEKDTAANVQSQVDIVNNNAAKSSQIVKDNYNALIKEEEQSYNELFDQNSVQRIINERTIAENMANMGLTDSGLNRTQMTANQLSFANNQSKISRQRQTAVNTLARAMNSKLAEIETNRATQETSIRTQAFNNNYAQAVSMYNSEQKAIADSIAATQKQIDAKNSARNVLIGQLGDSNLSSTQKTAYYNNYVDTHGLDASDASIINMIKASGVMMDDNGSAQPWTNSDVENFARIYYGYGTTYNKAPDFLSGHSSSNTNAVSQYGQDRFELFTKAVAEYAEENGLTEQQEEMLVKEVASLGYDVGSMDPLAGIRAADGSVDKNATGVFTKVKYSGSHSGKIAEQAIVQNEFGNNYSIADLRYQLRQYYVLQGKSETEATKLERRDVIALQEMLGIK